jgi:hypothetical protein
MHPPAAKCQARTVIRIVAALVQDVIWDFGQGHDGAEPAAAVVVDRGGNIFGTTIAGGNGGACHVQSHSGCGIVYELTPSGSGYSETILYNFQGGADGGAPYSGVVTGPKEGLYADAAFGGSGNGGTVYEISFSGDQPIVLYSFAGSGSGPNSLCPNCPGPFENLTFHAGDTMHGTAYNDGAYGKGLGIQAGEAVCQDRLGIYGSP